MIAGMRAMAVPIETVPAREILREDDLVPERHMTHVDARIDHGHADALADRGVKKLAAGPRPGPRQWSPPSRRQLNEGAHRRQMVQRGRPAEALPADGRHLEDHAALHVTLDAHVVALCEGIHFVSVAVDDHIDQ